MSVFFAYGAVVDPKDLIALAEILKLEEMKDIFLGGLSFVDNPFIPGLRCLLFSHMLLLLLKTFASFSQQKSVMLSHSFTVYCC